MTTNPIPPDYDSLIPYLVVRNGSEAMECYKKLFDAQEITRMCYPGTDRLMHAELKIRNHVLMVGDENPERGALSPQALNGPPPVSVMVYVKDVDEVFRRAIALGCNGLMPPTEMFWGDRFAKISDPFGHHWALATHVRDVSPEQMAKGAEDWAASAQASSG